MRNRFLGLRGASCGKPPNQGLRLLHGLAKSCPLPCPPYHPFPPFPPPLLCEFLTTASRASRGSVNNQLTSTLHPILAYLECWDSPSTVRSQDKVQPDPISSCLSRNMGRTAHRRCLLSRAPGSWPPRSQEHGQLATASRKVVLFSACLAFQMCVKLCCWNFASPLGAKAAPCSSYHQELDAEAPGDSWRCRSVWLAYFARASGLLRQNDPPRYCRLKQVVLFINCFQHPWRPLTMICDPTKSPILAP